VGVISGRWVIFLVGCVVDDLDIFSDDDANVSILFERCDSSSDFVNKSKLSFGGYLVPLSVSTHYTPVSEAKAATQKPRSNDDMNIIAPKTNNKQKKAPLYARYAPSPPDQFDSFCFFIVTKRR
jgi:hypothetical protein